MIHEERRVEILREHFTECLAHFARAFNEKFLPRKRGRMLATKPVKDFCGVTGNTVRRWFSEENSKLPIGTAYVKLCCYLDLHGYRIIEFEGLPKAVRNFSEVIGFGILSAEEAITKAGFTQTSEFFSVFRQERGLSSDKEGKMWQIWKTHRDELEAKKQEAFKKFRLTLFEDAHISRQINESISKIAESSGVSTCRSASLSIMRGLSILLDKGIFDGLSQEEIDSIEHDDAMCIAKLSSQLSVLSINFVRGRKG